MDWTKITIITTPDGIEPVCGRLLNIGINGFEIVDPNEFEDFLERKDGNWDYVDDDLYELRNADASVTVYLPNNAQGSDMLSSCTLSMNELKALDKDNKFGTLEIKLSGINETDWANNWKKYFKPLNVGNKLLIKPSWENIDSTNGRIVLEIDPESSFGTGQHNTTKLCLELLEKYLESGDRQLDIGSGSGILSVAGYLLGANDCTAVDIDENSVNISKQNALKNNIPSDKFTAFCGNILSDLSLRETISENGKFDILTANIVADVLIAMSPIFKSFMKSDAVIIISGIISERCNEVFKAMENEGFSLVEKRESELWVAAAFKIKEEN